MKRVLKRIALTLSLISVAALATAGADLDDVREIMRIAPNLNMHAPERQALDDYVYERFKATGFETGRVTFPTAVFQPGAAELTLADGTVFPLYAMHPNSANLANIPGTQWSGELFDAGRGSVEEYEGISVLNSAVLFDLKSRHSWVDALELGASVLIFAGGEADNNREAVAKLTKVPISAPRFYLTHEDAVKLRAVLAGSKEIGASVRQTRPNRWQYDIARCEWVIVPGKDNPETVVYFQTYKDARSIVPDFTPGAQTAANLALLLRILDDYAKDPPRCTTVISAVSDHCNHLRGEEFIMGSIFNDETALEAEMEQRHRDLDEANFYANIYADTSPEMIARLRDEKEWVAGRNLFLKQPINQELEYRRNKLRHRIAVIRSALDLRKEESKRAALEAEREGLIKELDDVVTISGILTRFGVSRSFEELTEYQQELFRGIMRQTEAGFREKAEDAQVGIDRVNANRVIAEKLKDKNHLLYVPFDISFGAETMGFFFQGSDIIGGSKWPEQTLPLARLSVEVAQGMEGGGRYFADTIQTTGGVPWRNYLPGKFPLASNIIYNMNIPGAGITTASDTRDLLFTPSDTLENVGEERIAGMLEFAERFIVKLFNDERILSSTRPRRSDEFGAITFRYNLRRIDPYSVEVPTEPVRNALVVLYPSAMWSGPTEPTGLTTNPEPVRGQVTSAQVALTDRQGSTFYRGTPKLRHYEAYGFDPETGVITSTLDAGSGARRMDPALPKVQLVWKFFDHIALMFDCVQTDLIGMYDPASRAPLPLARGQKIAERITILDAIREANPDHYSFAGIEETRSKFLPVPSDLGIISIFTEPGMPFKIVCDKLLLLNSSEQHPEGVGYQAGDPRLRMVSYTAAKDVQALNGMRSDRIEAKGVTIASARALYKKADGYLADADAARADRREMDFLERSVLSLSYAIRSYLIVRTTTTDLVKAIALFLALVIPFCVFTTKLLSPWTDIRAQISVFLAIFIVMAIGLAMLHPAFSLSQTPMMVLLAFAMVGLAVFVMLILHSRFDANLKRMVEEAQGVESVESSRKTLASVAFSVGVNNMRRRRIRTTLTATTIVLVTFTMLSVISVGQSLEPYRRRTDSQSPYNGVLFAKPGMAPIFDTEMEHVVALLTPYGKLVRRTWTQRLDTDGGYMPVTLHDPDDPGMELKLSSLLGVEKGEEGFLVQSPLVVGRWFSADDAKELILSVKAAEIIGITPENFEPRDLVVRTDRLKLVGLLDDDAAVNARDLAGLPWLPLQSIADPSMKNQFAETGEIPVSAEDVAGGPAPKAVPLKAIDVGLVPLKYAMDLPFTSYRSIAVKTDDPATAWKCAQDFVGATSMVGTTYTLTYTGLAQDLKQEKGGTIRAGQYSLGSPVGTSIGGVGKVVVPICLAATIILNTMLGAVMERKKEISVYNSIGLNPTHVFVFFVAEAIVFGLVGSVAGYLIGQGLSQAIVSLELLPGVNLNYSSMAVMIVIFASIATVVVSTLYPAYIATQAAVPSGQRRWKLPAPSGDELRLRFPFSYSEEHLPGVCAFLHQFMDLNSEASTGKFLAQDARFGYIRDVDGRKALVMVYDVTPTPFDLGVNQRMEIYGHYDPKVRAYVLTTHITRVKGSDSSWMIVNQPFLESLRARLLSWRSQSAANQEQFRRKGEEMFANAPELPTKRSSAA
jgi:hypothetical protein